MNFLKKLGKRFTTSAAPGRKVMVLQARCDRCGETVRTEVNLLNDLSVEYDDRGNPLLAELADGSCLKYQWDGNIKV